MSRRFKIVLLGMALGALAGPASANVIIGNWEDSTDGWIDWGTQAPVTGPKYGYSSDGATLGSSSLRLTQGGWNQNLSIKLQNQTPDLRPAFFANQLFSIDVSVPASTAAGGWAEVFTLYINAEGFGFVGQQPQPKYQWGFWPTAPLRTETLTWDYSHLIDGDTGNGEIGPTAGWIEFILTTNNDGVHTTFYFDNARLHQVPEPAALGAVAAAASALLLRRRRA